MAIRIVDVNLIPQHTIVGQNIFISVRVSEGNWNVIKNEFVDWQGLKDIILNWEEVRKL